MAEVIKRRAKAGQVEQIRCSPECMPCCGYEAALSMTGMLASNRRAMTDAQHLLASRATPISKPSGGGALAGFIWCGDQLHVAELHVATPGAA